MSATFKNSKKKLMQSELRKFMTEHKEKMNKKKIESPLAKYNEAGQLTCILCQSIVRSEAVWTVHVNSKQHRQNVDKAKRLKEQTNNFTTPASKRPAPEKSQDESEPKKIRGILKNAPNVTVVSTIEVVTNDDVVATEAKATVEEKMQTDEPEPGGSATETLPEGFFDDPKLDAKARNVEYKDPIEEEWEKFQKAIKDADHESAKIIVEDQEEATNERQIDEIEEQMKNWSRVLHLERKKVEIVSSANEAHGTNAGDESSSDGEEFDEYLDWRAKKAYK